MTNTILSSARLKRAFGMPQSATDADVTAVLQSMAPRGRAPSRPARASAPVPVPALPAVPRLPAGQIGAMSSAEIRSELLDAKVCAEDRSAMTEALEHRAFMASHFSGSGVEQPQGPRIRRDRT